MKSLIALGLAAVLAIGVVGCAPAEEPADSAPVKQNPNPGKSNSKQVGGQEVDVER